MCERRPPGRLFLLFASRASMTFPPKGCSLISQGKYCKTPNTIGSMALALPISIIVTIRDENSLHPSLIPRSNFQPTVFELIALQNYNHKAFENQGRRHINSLNQASCRINQKEIIQLEQLLHPSALTSYSRLSVKNLDTVQFVLISNGKRTLQDGNLFENLPIALMMPCETGTGHRSHY
jgi:hypothetical protein